MRALTIHQPWAHLIVTPQSELMRGDVIKRIENRTWMTRVRGPLLIHAGTSKKSLSSDEEEIYSEMKFGALLGVTFLEACYTIEQIRNGVIHPKHIWAKRHRHCQGPCCFVLGEVHRFEQPIKWLGKQRFFEVPDEVVENQLPDGLKLSGRP